MKCNSFRLFRSINLPVLVMLCLGMAMGCATDTGILPTSQDKQQGDVPKKITGIQVSKEPDADVVNIQGNTILSYTSIKQPSPLSVILYFPETIVSDATPVTPTDADVIDNITVSRVGDAQTGKLEIGLKKDVPYQVQRDGNSLKVSFARKATEVSVNATGPSVSETPISESGMSLADDSAVGAATLSRTYTVDSSKKGATKKSTGAAWVNRIDFSSEKKGKSSVIIGTTKPVQYRMEKVSPTAVQLRLYSTHISDFRKLPLITTRFESAVDRIRPLQTPAMKNDSIIALDLRESVPYYVEQEGDLIKIRFEASSIPPRPDAPLTTTFVGKAEEKQAKQAPRADQISSGKHERIVETSGETMADSTEARRSGVYRNDVPKVYTGEKIGIDFFDTDIRNVFRLLADYSGGNFAIDKDVQGKVTLAFEKPVPWDQVLDLVLRMNQLDKVQEGGIIRIARVKTLEDEEKSKQQLFEAERKAKEQSLELEPVVTEYIPVNYAKAKEEMMPHVVLMTTPNRKDCSVSVDERTNQLIATDTAAKVKLMRSIVMKLDRVTPQVVIEAKIVEAQTDFARDLGVNWNVQVGTPTYLPDGTTLNPATGQGGGTTLSGAAVNFPLTNTNVGSIGFNFTKLTGTPVVVNAQLQAMESNNKGKIISAPKILTLDNKEAFIEQGLEIGYLEQTGTNTAVLTTKFKKVTLNLRVTPHITQDNRVSMKIEIIKEDVVGYTPITNVPTLATKKAITELLVDDGDTLVIGGITKNTDTTGDNGVPYLAKIPLLGYLFGTKSDKTQNEELLIFMTPRIVQLEQRADKGISPTS
jgi:type IV pilus assembly protein PilQ